mmetsp:Transcript_15916/g.24489  ORF Transcript_15916/g.24489 Transcript_15916/m.24489 type:complete len:383 (+) Transcript_15916:34-1182(+)
MFGGYKFGDVSKGLYNKATRAGGNNNNNDPDSKSRSTRTQLSQREQPSTYQLGDFSKSAYKKVSRSVRSLTSQHRPLKIEIKHPVKKGFLHKQNERLVTYCKFWCVLDADTKSLYLFTDRSKYDECVHVLPLSVFNKVQAVTHFLHYASQYDFDVISASNERQRFSAWSYEERESWIKCIVQILNAHQLSELKLQLMSNTVPEKYAMVDASCIAYYIIDLEFNQSEHGDAHQLMRNQNFIVAAIVWSYMHDENARSATVRDAQIEKQRTIETWRKPLVAVHAAPSEMKAQAAGITRGVCDGTIAAVTLPVAGAIGLPVGMLCADALCCKDLTPLRGIAYLASVPAGAALGVLGAPIVGVQSGVTGYKSSYNKSKERMLTSFE